MTSHYDTYDYPSYWKGREYEHEAEIIALTSFLKNIPKVDTILEIGAGFGRLTPSYMNKAEKVILSDPSQKLLSIAIKKIRNKKVSFIISDIKKLPDKVKASSIDIIVMVRVLHHVKDLDNAFSNVVKLLKPGGYFILEFPNKIHMKAVLSEFIKGNLTFPLDIFTKEVPSKKTKPEKGIQFVNYHPDYILELLKQKGFEIKKIKSVSNFRSPFLKKTFKKQTLLRLSKLTQDLFACFKFGPSIFILAKKA